LIEALKSKSLRFWITLSMALSILPLAVSAGVGYVVLDVCVIAPFHDVAQRQRDQVARAQHIRLMIWDSLIPFDEFASNGGVFDNEAYNRLREQIETDFSSLMMAVADDPATPKRVRTAWERWRASSSMVDTFLVAPDRLSRQEEAALVRSFHVSTVEAIQNLRAIGDNLTQVIEGDYREATLCYRWVEWFAIAAGVMSLLAIAASVRIIGHTISNSVDRLVAGATRFAGGDRDHRIEVEIPSELRRVAVEFNKMIERVHISEEALADLAYRDSLTNLANRRVLIEDFAELDLRSGRSERAACLLAIDIDRFKAINDCHGHSVGDAVLRALAKTMTASLGPADEVYRTGGDEFVVLLRGADLKAAAATAERLRLAVASTPVTADGAVIHPTISIGVSPVLGDLKTTMDEADAALYRDKADGRNRIGGN